MFAIPGAKGESPEWMNCVVWSPLSSVTVHLNTQMSKHANCKLLAWGRQRFAFHMDPSRDHAVQADLNCGVGQWIITLHLPFHCEGFPVALHREAVQPPRAIAVASIAIKLAATRAGQRCLHMED